ncbi:patatin-like phospholipase domain-containing protein [Halosimplex halophilum]|uniref:hypothetical protein n=1 Tax=Halosimplex halophilum TaxID=2559572 RepID=UPI00107F2085|nr:hypothetical protein [Halosimplex halophilum]
MRRRVHVSIGTAWRWLSANSSLADGVAPLESTLRDALGEALVGLASYEDGKYINQSTFTQHLRAAERKLFAALFDRADDAVAEPAGL